MRLAMRGPDVALADKICQLSAGAKRYEVTNARLD
jgi:hypothetical protein